MNLTELIATLTAVLAVLALAYYGLRPRTRPAPRARPLAPPAQATATTHSDAATRLRRELAQRAQAARLARERARPRPPAAPASADFAPTTLFEDDPG